MWRSEGPLLCHACDSVCHRSRYSETCATTPRSNPLTNRLLFVLGLPPFCTIRPRWARAGWVPAPNEKKTFPGSILCLRYRPSLLLPSARVPAACRCSPGAVGHVALPDLLWAGVWPNQRAGAKQCQHAPRRLRPARAAAPAVLPTATAATRRGWPAAEHRALIRRSGGSLLQASLLATPDPDRASSRP